MRALLALALVTAAACEAPPPPTDLDWAQRAADMVHAALAADRAAYTKNVVNRLVYTERAIQASEEWKSEHGKLPLPAQMFRMGAESVLEGGDQGLAYVLLSEWPINKQNRARTDFEVRALSELAQNAEQPIYGTEDLGGTRYFTAVYPDVAVAEACVECHNEHRDSPRKDFVVGDLMGAMVIRFPL